VEVVELSATTGRLLRVLYKAAHPYTKAWTQDHADYCGVDSLAAVGLNVLVQCPGLGRVSDGRFTPLPGIQTLMSVNGTGEMAAW
jgi:hypothetical protein